MSRYLAIKKRGVMSLDSNLYIFRMVDSSDYVDKDPKGNLVYHNQLFDDECKEESDEIRRTMGHWNEDDLETLLEVGIYLNDSKMAAEGLNGLLSAESNVRIHNALRKGLISAWGESDKLKLPPEFSDWLGESLESIGKNRNDGTLALIGTALRDLGKDEGALSCIGFYLLLSHRWQ